MTHHDRQLAAFLARQLEPVGELHLMTTQAIALRQTVAQTLFMGDWQWAQQLIRRHKSALAPCDRIQ